MFDTMERMVQRGFIHIFLVLIAVVLIGAGVYMVFHTRLTITPNLPPESSSTSETSSQANNSTSVLAGNPVSDSTSVPVSSPPSSSTGVPVSNGSSPLGSNVNYIADWVSEIMLKDVGRRIRDFTCTPSPCTVDANGWPIISSGQTAATSIFTNLAGKYPTGTYHVFYDGVGSLNYSGGTRDAGASNAGHDVVTVTNNTSGFGYSITSSNPSPNHIRNIRVIIPGGDCGDVFVPADTASDCTNSARFRPNYQTYVEQPFYSRFLKLYRPYKAIRYLNVLLPDQGSQGGAILTTPRPWSARVKMTDAIWLRRGVPVELLVKLANTLHADPWFTIPHLANDLISDNPSDPYVRQFATYVRDNLNTDLKAYVEYSNEVWNGMFESSRHATQKGQDLGLSTADNKNLGSLRYQSQQSVKLFKIWNDVYGGRSKRIVRVIAAQGTVGMSEGEPYAAKNLLDWQEAYKAADALAVPEYFNALPQDQATVAAYTLDQLFAYIKETLIPRNILVTKDNAAAAKKRGLELIAYEGGQHLVELGDFQKNTNLNSLYNAANRDQRMGEAYAQLLNGWRENGGHLFVHFLNVSQQASGAFGRFGALESMLQDPAVSPKYQALMTFIADNPKWW